MNNLLILTFQKTHRDDQPLELTKEEEEEVMNELFAKDESARKAKEKHHELSQQISKIRKTNAKDVSVPE